MDNEIENQDDNKILIYTSDDGQVKIEVRLEDENVWLTQNAMAKLFNTTRNNITIHIKNIFEERELEEKAVSKESLLTASDGKKYKTKFYNLDLLNRMVSAYLDVAEINALNMHPMTMKDWTKELDGFLTMTHKDILEGKGSVSHEKALKKAHQEYDKYVKTHLTQAEKDYLEIMGEDIKNYNKIVWN